LTAGKCSPSKGLAAEREKEKSRKMKTTSGDSLPKKNPQKKGIPLKIDLSHHSNSFSNKNKL